MGLVLLGVLRTTIENSTRLKIRQLNTHIEGSCCCVPKMVAVTRCSPFAAAVAKAGALLPFISQAVPCRHWYIRLLS